MFISEAYAQAAGAAPGGTDMLASFLPLVLIFVVFWFLMIRPQQKRMKEHRALVAALKPGAKAKVFFDLRGREWKESYYVNLNAWKIEAVGAAPAAPADEEEGPLPEEPGQPVDEDVPF